MFQFVLCNLKTSHTNAYKKSIYTRSLIANYQFSSTTRSNCVHTSLVEQVQCHSSTNTHNKVYSGSINIAHIRILRRNSIHCSSRADLYTRDFLSKIMFSKNNSQKFLNKELKKNILKKFNVSKRSQKKSTQFRKI